MKIQRLALFRLIFPLLLATALLACSSLPPARKTPVSEQRPIADLLTLTAYPNSEPLLALLTMQQLTATHREWEGYQYFGHLAEQQPERRAFFRSLQGVLQARVAGDVPLLRRIAWVEDAIAKLDAGVAADPSLGRLGRGLTFAALPARFGKAQQAVLDLNAVLNGGLSLPLGVHRGVYQALASAYRTLGDSARSAEMLSRAGVTDPSDAAVRGIIGDLSVDAVHGFRFSAPELRREADDVYVAEGYDFANLGFIVTPKFVVAIDAGTTAESARSAVLALRHVTSAPIKYVILTHGHWDHVGGIAAVREPGSTVIASAGFSAELQHSRDYPQPFRYFFGSGHMQLDVTPDRIVREPEVLRDDGLELTLMPAPSGETSDALFVHYPRQRILFVGDAFMPYLGAPFVAEGSAEGYLGAVDRVLELAPEKLIHGHPPLSRLFTMPAVTGLREPLRELYAHALGAAQNAQPLADVLKDHFLPASLRNAPAAAQPYLIVRDTLVQRLFQEHAGYWSANGDGIDQFTRGEWATALDLLAGENAAAFARTADELEQRGDAALALHIADSGLARYPQNGALKASRERALNSLRALNAQANPFRFIVYSEWAGKGLAPVTLPAPGATTTKR